MEKTEKTTKESAEKTEKTDTPRARVMPFTWKHFSIDLFTRLTSRSLWMVIFACGSAWGCLERGVNHLYALETWQAATYGGMFTIVMGGIVTMLCKYMGVEHTSASVATMATSAIQSVGQNLFEKREENKTVEFKIDPRFQTQDLIERYEDR